MLDDVGDMVEVKQALTEAVLWPLRYPDTFTSLGVSPPRGVLLYGPPGCGKTFLVRALAGSGEANVLTVKGAELLSKWVGESEAAVRELFRRARESAPALVFLDEVDALAPVRGAGNDGGTTDRVVAALLTELDGVEQLRDVVVVAATNRPDRIDPALLRPGRLERLVFVPPPDAAARTEILRAASRRVPLQTEETTPDEQRWTDGVSPPPGRRRAPRPAAPARRPRRARAPHRGLLRRGLRRARPRGRAGRDARVPDRLHRDGRAPGGGARRRPAVARPRAGRRARRLGRPPRAALTWRGLPSERARLVLPVVAAAVCLVAGLGLLGNAALRALPGPAAPVAAPTSPSSPVRSSTPSRRRTPPPSSSRPPPPRPPSARCRSPGARSWSTRGTTATTAAPPTRLARQVDAGGSSAPCDTAGSTSGTGYAESTFTWRTAQALKRRLQALGAEVVLTRQADAGVGPCVDVRGLTPGPGRRPAARLAARRRRAASRRDRLPRRLARPRRRAHRGHGRAVGPAGPRRPRRLRARGLRPSTYAGRDGLDVRTDLGTLNRSSVPAVLVECGNLRDAAEARRLASGGGQEQCAAAVADGVLAFLG